MPALRRIPRPLALAAAIVTAAVLAVAMLVTASPDLYAPGDALPMGMVSGDRLGRDGGRTVEAWEDVRCPGCGLFADGIDVLAGPVRAGAVAIVLHPLGDTSDPLARAMACLADRGRWTLWTWLVRNAGLVRDARFGAPELARIADRLDTTPERLAACLADPGTDGVVRAAREAAAFGTLPHYRVDGVDLPAGAGLADVLAALRGDETDQ